MELYDDEVSYSAQQDSMSKVSTAEVLGGIVSFLFWNATAPTTWNLDSVEVKIKTWK